MKRWGLLLLTIVTLGHYTSCLPTLRDNNEEEIETIITRILNLMNREDEKQSQMTTEDPFESEVLERDGKLSDEIIEDTLENELFDRVINTAGNEGDSENSDSEMNYKMRMMDAAQQLSQNPRENSLDLQKANLVKSIKERLDEIEYKRYVDNLKPGDLHEGDILVDEDLIARLRGTDMDERQYTNNDRKKWRKTGDTVIIRYDDSAADEGAKKIFEQAISWINHQTCVNIVKLRGTFPNYIKLTSDSSKPCMSSIGKKGGAQILNLRSTCQTKGTAIHEILHALGFFHEQSRCDRGLYVNIFQQNIRPAAKSQFNCINGLKTFGVPYNPKSIMHYRNTEFSKNGKSTIQSKSHPSLQLGSDDLSDLDVLLINKAFNCPLDKYAVAVYTIELKTKGGFSFGAGTDSDVDLLIVFDNNKEFDGILIKGEGAALEKGSITNREIVLPAEGNIEKIVARVVTDTAFGDWKPEWVRITVQTSSSTKLWACVFPDGTDIEYGETAATQWCVLAQ